MKIKKESKIIIKILRKHVKRHRTRVKEVLKEFEIRERDPMW